MNPIRSHTPRLTTPTRLLLALLVCLMALVAACSAQTPVPDAPKAAVPEAPKAAAPTQAPAAQKPAEAPKAPEATSAPKAAIATQAPAAPAAAPAKFAEAPVLAEQVKGGKLPVVEQRLPKTPLVVKPLETVGKYGGNWRQALVGGADTLLLNRTIAYEHLVRWDPEWTSIIPNVAESFQISPDAKEYTFKLREGMKWSDGQPFTADDIMFWYEDVSLDKELTPNRGVNPPTVEKVDQYSVKFKFAQPNGLFLAELSGQGGAFPTQYPKHYLRQFHKKYNTTNLDQLIADNKAENWVKLFQLKGATIPGTPYDARWSNPDLPVLNPWQIKQPYTGSAQVTAERNPYYFKVDTAGNQLPYIDKVTFDIVQNTDVLTLKALNGEIDMQSRNVGILSNKALFIDNQQKGGFRLFDWTAVTMNTQIISLNLTHKDPVKREIFRNKDFRIGLSHAINRQEIIDLIFVGQGEPWQAAPRRDSEFFDEQMAKQYTEYNVAKANEYLDKAYPKKDANGIRLGTDSKPISFVVEATAGTGADRLDSLKQVVGYWKKVGVDAQFKDLDRSLFDTRRQANEHDAAVWDGAGGRDVILNPPYYFPWSTRADYAQAWVTFYLSPTGAGARTPPEEPPAATKKQIDLYRELSQTGDAKKQDTLMREILKIAKDEFYTIGISVPANSFGIVKNNMKNVPKSIPNGNTYPDPAPTNPSTYFFE